MSFNKSVLHLSWSIVWRNEPVIRFSIFSGIAWYHVLIFNSIFQNFFILLLYKWFRFAYLVWYDCREILCPIAGCGARLTSLEGFEDHYNGSHTASCSVCHKAYPTQRLLSIHVSEVHDSYFKAKVARGYPMVSTYTKLFISTFSFSPHTYLPKTRIIYLLQSSKIALVILMF